MEPKPPAMIASTSEYPIYDSDNSMENSEDESSSGSLNFDDWMNILSLLIAPLGLVGNGAVLWLLGFRIRRNHFSVYILNLAGADALFLCCSLLDSIDELLKCNSDYLIWRIQLFFSFMSYTVGLSLLAAISTERCLSALFPIWYRCRRPKHTSAAVCAWFWALAGLLELLPLVFEEYLSSCDSLIVTEVVYFFFLTCVMCLSSLTLLLRFQCSNQFRQPPRLYLLVVLTVLMFLLFGLPWGIWKFMSFQLNVNFMSFWPFEALACVNSSVNPLIYFFMGRQGNKRREPLRVVLQRALRDEQELGGGTTNTSHTSNQET